MIALHVKNGPFNLHLFNMYISAAYLSTLDISISVLFLKAKMTKCNLK